MRAFTYAAPSTAIEALEALSTPKALPLSGGTDLLVTLKERVVEAEHLVDLRHLAGAHDITFREDGSARIGAAVAIAELAANAEIRARYGALAEAAESVGTPALRNMGTIGGNLGQRVRCWYFRRGVACFKTGGTGCPAAHGENQYNAIITDGPCHATHPSDPAVALTALDASVEIMSAGGATRTVPITELFARAAHDPAREIAVGSGEFISAIELPAHAMSDTQHYWKLMQRGAWDFALVSLAVVKRANGEVALVLGGVAPQPYVVNPSIGEDVQSGGLDAESIDALAERAMYDMEPLSQNGYKVTQAVALLKRAMTELGT
jgi:xanthine dehydrogenase YagS FAD-binding subunit